MTPLVSWDGISIRVDGARVNALARQQVAGQLDDLTLTFRAGQIHVAGRRKVGIIPLPFFADINSIAVEGKSVVVPVSIPAIVAPVIRAIAAAKVPPFVTVRPPLTFVVQLDRFLPSFVDVQIREIRIIDGGLAVNIGPGGVSWK
jgi:hypothetical protein